MGKASRTKFESKQKINVYVSIHTPKGRHFAGYIITKDMVKRWVDAHTSEHESIVELHQLNWKQDFQYGPYFVANLLCKNKETKKIIDASKDSLYFSIVSAPLPVGFATRIDPMQKDAFTKLMDNVKSNTNPINMHQGSLQDVDVMLG